MTGRMKKMVGGGLVQGVGQVTLKVNTSLHYNNTYS